VRRRPAWRMRHKKAGVFSPLFESSNNSTTACSNGLFEREI